ncbi:EPIDERMAL PATTERNING FACTOR-like protein 5 [Phalaenopsis equestris]|uniref:EPIDERMAL PATTERNING FACTOR-like protein 5 n=1 Tax=Phalaenopsis equestris TaxID=78828 RepID=UPI0009E1FB7A|nr:EPIDERMAL PATTERNING FACTOR-like protein 5 [Phalaenopsis equestris]
MRCAIIAVSAVMLLIAISSGSGLSLNQAKDQQWRLPPQTRRRLAGPGSSPPICRSRCGDCFPCRPIHVAIQKGQIMPLEYYPEAWRCKCRNKLFLP